jgi:hypothetical protein
MSFQIPRLNLPVESTPPPIPPESPGSSRSSGSETDRNHVEVSRLMQWLFEVQANSKATSENTEALNQLAQIIPTSAIDLVSKQNQGSVAVKVNLVVQSIEGFKSKQKYDKTLPVNVSEAIKQLKLYYPESRQTATPSSTSASYRFSPCFMATPRSQGSLSAQGQQNVPQ